MDPFTMIVCIVLISVGGAILGKYLDQRRRVESRTVSERLEKVEQLDIDSIEERLRALEKIVTDSNRSSNLKEKIDSL